MGVLQGSVLRKFVHTNLVYTNSAIIKMMNVELCAILCWVRLNKLSLNIKKNNNMLFGRGYSEYLKYS